MEKKAFYLEACSPEAAGGIYRYELEENGKVTQTAFTRLENANYMAWSPDRKKLYSTCTMDGTSGGVAAFSVQADGSLSLLNKMASGGLSTCYVITDPAGKFLYCANYRSGSVSEFALGDDGSILRRTKLIQHTGHGPNEKRQESAHTHFTNITPDQKYLVVVDLGIDALCLYPLDPVNGIPEKPEKVFHVQPAGSGPRHLVFNRAGDRAYLLNELGSTVMSLAYADGEFSPVQTLTTLPELFSGATKASAIRLSEDEKFLYCSNRGFDSIACFRVDQSTGKMELFDMVLSGGSSPRDIHFLPGYRQMAACNEFSDIVVFYNFNPKTGKLTPNGQSLSLPRPLAIWW